ncbi:hypothetical protein ScPMuIL_010960 [Solemya velum]
MTEGEFTHFYRSSLMDCVTECLLSRHCQALSYNREVLHCFLHEYNNQTGLRDRNGYFFSDITSWPKFWLGPCLFSNCSTNEKCVLDEGVPSCVISECTELPVLANALIPYGHRGVNDTRTYQCDLGYKTDWDPVLRCGRDGQWEYHHPPCRIINCGNPTTFLHSVNNMTGTTFASSVTSLCDAGYTAGALSIERTCGADERWTNQTLECEIVSCNDTKDVLFIPNTARKMSSTTYGSAIEYNCVTGYNSTQKYFEKTCLADGNWSTNSLECIAICFIEEGYEYQSYSGLCLKYINERINHGSANSRCSAEGASLARIDSGRKHNDAVNFMKKNNANGFVHIQGSDRADNGDWRYDDGDRMRYTRWKKREWWEGFDEPNGWLLQYYVGYYTSDYRWYDENENEKGSYLCEKYRLI